MKKILPSLIGALVIMILGSLFWFGVESTVDHPPYTTGGLLFRFGVIVFVGVLMFVLDMANPAWEKK